MYSVYGVEPRLDNYSCMVDLLGRSACLKDAYELIKRMPMEPNHGVWEALLNACRICNNVELEKEVAERLFALEPSDRRNYVAASHWKEASKKQDPDQDVKEDMIKEHSEKLALAFGLLVTEEGLPLVITKNLKIYEDCHNMAKFVSLTEDRVIIIRDVKQFHHFAYGLCSCGDYW
ncbi:Pentatricopeptide repeat-containing protein [Abeliophyllum distichum]|uniref:Pentatricopeptide repeat-containing protein n=1 Tax=Abeliophyllum distichum TaxID=126358 RepID=A0ABD1NZN3_9LAMI